MWVFLFYRTYYFGVRYVSQNMYGGQTIDDDFEEEIDKLSGSALRNMTQDVEKLAQHIQGTNSEIVFDLFWKWWPSIWKNLLWFHSLR